MNAAKGAIQLASIAGVIQRTRPCERSPLDRRGRARSAGGLGTAPWRSHKQAQRERVRHAAPQQAQRGSAPRRASLCARRASQNRRTAARSESRSHDTDRADAWSRRSVPRLRVTTKSSCCSDRWSSDRRCSPSLSCSHHSGCSSSGRSCSRNPTSSFRSDRWSSDRCRCSRSPMNSCRTCHWNSDRCCSPSPTSSFRSDRWNSDRCLGSRNPTNSFRTCRWNSDRTRHSPSPTSSSMDWNPLSACARKKTRSAKQLETARSDEGRA